MSNQKLINTFHLYNQPTENVTDHKSVYMSNQKPTNTINHSYFNITKLSTFQKD